MKELAERKMQTKTLFAQMDRSGDGFLTRREFVDGLKKVNVSACVCVCVCVCVERDLEKQKVRACACERLHMFVRGRIVNL